MKKILILIGIIALMVLSGCTREIYVCEFETFVVDGIISYQVSSGILSDSVSCIFLINNTRMAMRGYKCDTQIGSNFSMRNCHWEQRE